MASDPAQRRVGCVAVDLPRAQLGCQQGEAALAEGRAAITAAGFDLDYLELRAADDLGDPRPGMPWRLLVAARLGATRLIDNIAV